MSDSLRWYCWPQMWRCHAHRSVPQHYYQSTLGHSHSYPPRHGFNFADSFLFDRGWPPVQLG